MLSTRRFTVAVPVTAVRLVLVAALLLPLLTGGQPARAGVLQTISDFLSLGANTIREIQEAIRVAGEEVRVTLEQLRGDLAQIMADLQRAYQDNLNITLNSLDAATRNKLLELQALMEGVHEKIQEDIRLVSAEAQEVIRQASLQTRRVADELRRDLEEVIIVGGETAAFVLDRAFYNAILIVALVLLGIGLLVFIWLLFTRRLPQGGLSRVLALLFMALYLVVFGAIVLVPQARAFVMTATGLGLRERLEKITLAPRILEVFPETITIGTTREVQVWGSSLTPNNQRPTATIGGQSVAINAASNEQIVLDVSTLGVPDGSTDLVLTYTGRDPLTAVVRVLRPTPVPAPAELRITAFTISPASPVERNNARATVTIQNAGQTAARNFHVQWRPRATDTATAITRSVAQLDPGMSASFTFDFAYIGAGTFDTVVVVDPFDRVAESNEANNSVTRQVTVQPAPPRQARVTVTFTSVTVHDDADPLADGELWLDFIVGGQTGRFPSSGTRSVNSGDTVTVNRTFTLTLTEGTDLTIFVKGTDEDAPGFPTFDDHDDMGTVSRRYTSAASWGAGTHSERSTCPDGCYTIHYTITAAFLN